MALNNAPFAEKMRVYEWLRAHADNDGHVACLDRMTVDAARAEIHKHLGILVSGNFLTDLRRDHGFHWKAPRTSPESKAKLIERVNTLQNMVDALEHRVHELEEIFLASDAKKAPLATMRGNGVGSHDSA